MDQNQTFEDIPRGNTCRGVNRAILEYLAGQKDDFAGKWILDIPCGEGTLLRSLRRFFPKACLRGADLQAPSQLTPEEYAPVDASRLFSIFPERRFDLAISVSGVLEFENTLQFFQSLRKHLKADGALIVTNDNMVSVRDRLEYLLVGKVRHPYDIFVSRDQVSWKVVPIHNLVRVLEDAGFTVKEIRYVPVRSKDWLLLPLALALYPIQWAYARLSRTKLPLRMRQEMYPFASLLSRHYLIIAEPAKDTE
jgi:2-polyprenyl-3-methyl-5-hydroxy-6-metoxy-1,4-benzoquinol methylase